MILQNVFELSFFFLIVEYLKIINKYPFEKIGNIEKSMEIVSISI